MVYLDKNGKKVNKLGFNLILSERLRTLRKKVFSIPFFMPEKDIILPTLKFFSIKLRSLAFILVYTAINLIFLEF